MTVLAAVSIPSEEKEIHAKVQELRMQTQDMFFKRFKLAVQDGQLSQEMNIQSLSFAMNTLLEGLSVQAKSGISIVSLQEIPQIAVRMLGHC